jgi:hypothetical protein
VSLRAGAARAVLVGEFGPNAHQGRLKIALEGAARAGYDLVAIVAPRDWRTALQMLADGGADVIVASMPYDLPCFAVASLDIWPVPEMRTAPADLEAELPPPVAESEVAESVTPRRIRPGVAGSGTGVPDPEPPPVRQRTQYVRRTGVPSPAAAKLPASQRRARPVDRDAPPQPARGGEDGAPPGTAAPSPARRRPRQL